MVLITLVAVVGYLALAIWGAGGIDAFFSEPARIALALVGFALGIAALFSSGHIGAGEREDRGNRWVIVVFGVVGLLLGYLPAYTERQGFWLISAMACAGWASFFPPVAAGCGSILSLCWAAASAAWLPSNLGTHWSPKASMASSGTRAIWGC